MGYAGRGVAAVDFDGDGLLDIYLVTAAELTPARARVPHRNVLYRNLGGWKFQDVSKQAGVDLAAWGRLGLSVPQCLTILESTATGVTGLCEALAL